MRNDILASFLHCSSSDAKPQHELCPKTKDSWCFYQRAMAKGEAVPSHTTMKVNFQLLTEFRRKALAEYKRLTSDKLLSACLPGKMQNPNEHLHSRICRYCLKYKNANKNIMDFAVAQAVCDYNVWYYESHLGTLLAFPKTEITNTHLQRRDRKRESFRKKTQRKRKTKVEGDYAAGTFNPFN